MNTKYEGTTSAKPRALSESRSMNTIALDTSDLTFYFYKCKSEQLRFDALVAQTPGTVVICK